jgi:stearoyl-CoA desaturase (delta-9 desaturase)
MSSSLMTGAERPGDRFGQSRTIVSPFLQARYRRIGLVTFGAPALATIVAIGTVPYVGPPSLAIIGLLIAFYVISVLGLEVGYHRHFTHRAFRAAPRLRAVLAVCGGMGASGPIIYWTATHRLHHVTSDDAGDPHSPHLSGAGLRRRLRGLWHAQIGWMLEGSQITNATVMAKDLLRDPQVVRLNRLYPASVALGLVVPTAAGWLLDRSWHGAMAGLLWGGFVRIFLVQLLYTGALNSLCHWFGYRSFDTGDRSTNNPWLALVTMGESWHNNHHAFPASARLNFRAYELDMAGLLVGVFESLHWVWDVQRPSAIAIKRASMRGDPARTDE